ncbi:MAG: immunoglobulin domain-containing protein, partial [Solirubrobacterales bacterium]
QLDRVYSIATGENVEPTVAAVTRNPDTTGWEPAPNFGSYGTIDIGVGNTGVREIVATTFGKLVGTYPATFASGTGPDDQEITRKPMYSFSDTGEALVPTEITGTAFSPPTIHYPTGLPVGYANLIARPGGSVTANEFSDSATRQTINLDGDGVAASGFVVSPTTLAIPFNPLFAASDVGADLYYSTSDTVSLFHDGGLFASSDAGPTVRGIFGGSGRVYAFTGASAPYKLSAMSMGGYSPSITTDPSAQSIVVGSAGEVKSVTLNSAGSGTPLPTVRWQKQLSGESAWNDISGATDPDLTFGATAANNGDSYRAVYSNVAGEIATASAQLTVTVVGGNPPVVTPPIGIPAPAAIQAKNGKSVKLKFKKGKSARVTVGTVTCASTTTCVYTLPTSIKFKIGKKSYKAKVAGPASLEPGKSQAIYATVPASAVKALKGKKSKLIVSVQVANSAGVKHDTAKNIIGNIRA